MDTAFAARLLDAIGNAALVASAIRGADILDIPAKVGLLRSVGLVFDLNDRWTGRTTAWMILLDIEEKLLAPLQAQNGVVRSGGARPSDPLAIIGQEVAIAAEALLSRPDGARLSLEWLAHLHWSVLRLPTQSLKAGGDDLSAFEPWPLLLKALLARFGQEGWANPLRIWALFGGSLLAVDKNNLTRPARKAPLFLPLWRDWLGKPNTLVPIAVAMGFWDSAVLPSGWLAEWVRHLCQNLEGHPAMHQLVAVEASLAARYLAAPLVCSGLPSERFSELWSDANWQLTKARFSKLEDHADVVQPCVALICVGLHMLEFSGIMAQTQNATC